MKKKGFKRITAALAACMVMTSAMPVVTAPVVLAAGNIIKNSTFESGTSGWAVYKESGGSYSLGTDSGRLALTVKNRGTCSYAVQLNYDIIPLYENGVYRFSFDISSTADRYVEAMIQQNGGKYTAYTWKGINVTSTPQTIDYEFTMKYETDIMSKMCFNCGIEKQDPDDLPEHTIYLDNVVLELVDDSKVDYSATQGYQVPININQVGYKTNGTKKAVIRGNAGSKAYVVDAKTDKVVYTGELGSPVSNSAADETNYVFDFSSFTDSGKYYIKCDGIEDHSYSFMISGDPYTSLLDQSVRMLYLQRCGMAIDDSRDGSDAPDFSHPACHTSEATIYGTSNKIDVTGGWHDAGDYGRYTVAAAKAVADLLYAYKTSPDMFGDNLRIPESGNGIPDILDEVRYELEWMMKMQDKTDGGVYHKVSCANFPAYVMPDKETGALIVMPKSTAATADFAASMALAAEVYIDVDSTFASKCLVAAENAYLWAKENPNVYYSNPNDVVTGEYGDKNANDELYWAAAQLYRATCLLYNGNSQTQKYLDDIAAISTKNKTGLDWSTVGDYGNIAILTAPGADKNSDVYAAAKNSIISQADDLASTSEKDPYGASVAKYNWGSNMTIANYGIILGTAYSLTGDEKYVQASEAQLNYLLGTNANGKCFVTGFGTDSPENPHHRPSMAAGGAMVGMLVGGVNSSLEDSAAKAYCADSPRAKCYVDNAESYSTNEITIYWNSPLTYLLAVSKANEGTTPVVGGQKLGDANDDGEVNLADAVLIMQSLANPGKYKLSSKGADLGDVNLRGNGITSADALAIQRYLLGLVKTLPESYAPVDQTTTTSRTTTTTTSKTTTTTTTTTTTAASQTPYGFKDLGTPMNKNATMVEDFRDGNSKYFFASDGWTNGDCFDCWWYDRNTSLNQCLTLSIDRDWGGNANYSGAEYRTHDNYSYGYYETSMIAIKNDGVVSSFFTYTGPSENNPWDEIDIEILGKDTTKVQLNYYTNGEGKHEFMYDLGFDASQAFHTYGFDWQRDHITWYVDGKPVHTMYGNIPKTPGKIMMNTWPGTGVDEWLNHYNGRTPLTAYYQWATYNANGPQY